MFSEESFNKNALTTTIGRIQEECWIRKRHPHVGGIEITPYCNLRCVHCYLQGNTYGKLMSTDQIQLIIDKLYDAGVLFLYLTGGEILTREDFLDIYIYAKKKGFLVELLTNGTLINTKIIDVFRKYPPASVSISMYGKDSRSYQRVTGDGSAYFKVIESFKMLQENNIHFEIKYIGVKENAGDLLDIKKIADRFGASFSYSMELFPTLIGDSCPKLHMIPLEKIVEYELKLPGKEKEFENLSLIENPFIGKNNIPLYKCDMAISNFLIDYRGFLNPCHKCRFETWNLLECDFNDAWQYYGKMRNILSSPSNKCDKCKYVMMCSPCVIVNYLSTGDYDTPPETTCALTKLRIGAISKQGRQQE